MQLKMRHISCWNVPYTNPSSDKFSSLFENVVPRSLKSFFQLDQQVNLAFSASRTLNQFHCKVMCPERDSWMKTLLQVRSLCIAQGDVLSQIPLLLMDEYINFLNYMLRKMDGLAQTCCCYS